MGCVVMMEGEGEVGFRFRNDNAFAFYHSVDGDKEGKKARFESELNESGMSLLLGEPETGPPTPVRQAEPTTEGPKDAATDADAESVGAGQAEG